MGSQQQGLVCNASAPSMLLQKWGGCTGLPSRYRVGSRCLQRCSAEMEASGLAVKDFKSSRKNLTSSQGFPATQLEKSGMNGMHSPKVLLPAKLVVKAASASLDPSSSSPVRGNSREFLCPRHLPRAKSMSPQQETHSDGMGLTNGAEYNRQHPNSSAFRRRHSLSRLPSCDTWEYSPLGPSARRAWSSSTLALQKPFLEEIQGRELGEMSCGLQGPSKELGERNLELELNMMQFELFSLKQKQMESSFAHLEKEKRWLETNRSEGKKQKGDLDDKIFHLEMELEKATSYLGKRNPGSTSLDSKQNVVVEKKDIGLELLALQESLVAHKRRIKALERKRDEMAQQLKSVEEGQRKAFSQISEANQRATDSLQANQVLQEERGRLQANYNSISLEKACLEDNMNELNLKLEPALADRARLLQEKVALHQQVQRLTLELECAQKKQEGSSGQVSALHSELISAKTQIDHRDKEKVLMKKELESVRQANEELSSEVAERHQRLEASLEKLHHLEAEKMILDNRIQALEDERSQLLGEKEGSPPPRQLAGQNQEEEIKVLQESCENLRESQTSLQREKELLQAHCLELEVALQGKQKVIDSQLAEQQYWRDRWEQATTALKMKEEELEKYAECSSEKQRLEDLVTSLEEQLVEKEKALRELKQMKNMDRTELQSKIPSSESKSQHRGIDGKGIGSPQQDQGSLKWQHRLVTEQLKDLFRQKQQEAAGYGAHPGGFKEPQASPGMPAAAESIGLQEGGQTESPEVSSSRGEASSLQQQLKEKTERIFSMAAELQALKQKNESLMKAKLRFQQQIQEIRRLSKHLPERSRPDRLVPRLSVGPEQDLQTVPASDSAVPSPQSDKPAFSLHGGENPQVVLQGPRLHPKTEDKQSHVSSTPVAVHLLSPRSAGSPLPLHPGQAGTGTATSPHDPRGSVEGEGALLSAQGSGHLSPRPFGPQRPWSPFKLSSEPPEN